MSSINNLTEERIGELLCPYGITLDGFLFDRVRSYIELLLRWNQKISLTSITDIDEIVRFHFGESFIAVKTFDIASGRLADVGSGAGFPGIPIKLLRPDLNVSLIEANLKKAAFLAEVCRRLDIGGVTIRKERLGEIGAVQPFDFITVRAVGSFEGILSWSHTHVMPDGKVVLWLGGEDVEKVAKDHSEWEWSNPLKIPHSLNRYILSGMKKP